MGALAQGSTGGPVKKLQIDLNKVISAGLKTNGTYDEKTKSAVIQFQKRAGLSVNGTADPGTVKSLKAHVVGLDWPHGDPTKDQNVDHAIEDIEKGVPKALKDFSIAESECRAVADILKKKTAEADAAAAATVTEWTKMSKLFGELAVLKKNFETAKKGHDLATQKDILAKAQAVQGKIEVVNLSGGAKFQEMAAAAILCREAIERVTKLGGEKKKSKCGI